MSSRTLPARAELSASASAEAWAGRSSEQAGHRVKDYLHLVKARLSTMVVASAVVAYWLGATSVDAGALLWFTIGTFLVVGGANAFNQVLERGPDARMERTSRRPLPTGRLSVVEATAAASLMSGGGLALVYLSGGLLSAALGVVALFVYIGVYTPLKPRSSWSTVPGAVAGALPTLMGWSAAEGGISALGLCLFGILFFWQFPHTWAIAATYREDYERVGYRALPASGRRAQVVAATLALVAMSLLPTGLGLVGPGYGLGALALGGGFLAAALRFGDGTERGRAAALLAVSLFYLPLVLALAVFVGKV
jgi:protoheme IX farnesyltransferase